MKKESFNNLENTGFLPIVLVVAFAAPIAMGVNFFLATRVGYAFSEAMGTTNVLVGIFIIYFMAMMGILNSVFRSRGYGNDERADSNTQTTIIDRLAFVTSKEYSRRERNVISISFIGYLLLQVTILIFCSMHFNALQRVSPAETIICWFVGMWVDFLTGYLYAYWKEKNSPSSTSKKIPVKDGESDKKKDDKKVTKLPALVKDKEEKDDFKSKLQQFKDKKMGKN